ncbi:hypothetical protein A9G41_13075 [Gilliamella sp. Nev5-1]|uniref:hypothetical protein n=1 Tax=unclassified Gilliamella TaxID=2685620 RepID=UPI00080DC91F|nr:hypothetical protein [Gilliamella apicola]OCG61418.1 hypothetical protein A9G40_00805 [Gilliamella apicola]OCG66206.1 hypothetical protein A9G41_13075 [Gilliamella apicola]
MAGGAEFNWVWEGEGQDVRCLRQWGNFGQIDERYTWQDENVIVTMADGSQKCYTHKDGLLQSEIDANGATKTYQYNEEGLKTVEIDALGHQTHYEYTVNILGGLNSYQYVNGDPINWIDPLGLIKVADKGVEGIVGKEADTQLVPDTFVSDVTTHNKQLGVINRKQGTISGAHNQDAFLESIEITGAKIVNPKYTDRQYPGLIEYQYQIPAIAGNGPNAGKVTGYKGVERKTTYDPAILSDAKVAEMSNKAAHQAKDYFQSNPTKNVYDTKVGGYWFRVTHDPKTNKINNAFLTMPPRSIR